MKVSLLWWGVGRSYGLAAIGLAAALVLAGCEQRRYVIVPVSGRITFEGKPMEGVHVNFQPQGGGPASVGVTDKEGRYTLRRIDTQQPGAIVGTHRVYFSLAAENVSQDDAGRPVKSRLPEKYRKGMIMFTVPPSGTNQADFQLSSRP
ncbi:MAG: carboxypeptidase-like regulatory domain-containing protein [Thermoguttaceae bacterium]|nr:carboxypeptidase-like regulatory domain-containing protein [Thermoguttaceae bacterium]MDW8036937.1 carboxypeptidase-like regulatory domain-containing protein [Thermoguttaceae bacterium]